MRKTYQTLSISWTSFTTIISIFYQYFGRMINACNHIREKLLITSQAKWRFSPRKDLEFTGNRRRSLFGFAPPAIRSLVRLFQRPNYHLGQNESSLHRLILRISHLVRHAPACLNCTSVPNIFAHALIVHRVLDSPRLDGVDHAKLPYVRTPVYPHN